VQPIESERLVIRTLGLDDWADVFAYAADPEVMEFIPEKPYTPESTMAFAADNPVVDGLPSKFAVTLKPDGRLIGTLTLHLISPRFRCREIGWVFHPAYYGQGYAGEAALALLRHAFAEGNVRRVVATCDPRNTASWRIMERLGFRREGHFLRDVRLVDGGWHDEYFYAILDEEWAARAGGGK